MEAHNKTEYMEREKRRLRLGLGVLVLLHLVGLAGFHFAPTRPIFQQLVPVNLILSALILGWFHRGWSQGFVGFCGIVYLAGMAIEWAGVHSQVLFGPYRYGEALGWAVWEVPVVMGLNWLTLVYATAISTQGWPVPKWAKIALAAAMMVGLDLLIEPVAIREDFWHWEGGEIPLRNYLAWFFLSLPLQAYFHGLKPLPTNPLARAYLGVQALFFGSFLLIRVFLSFIE